MARDPLTIIGIVLWPLALSAVSGGAYLYFTHQPSQTRAKSSAIETQPISSSNAGLSPLVHTTKVSDIGPGPTSSSQASSALTDSEISPSFYCLGIFSSARLIADLTLMARADEASSQEIKTIKNNREKFSEVESAFKAILGSYASSQSIDPRYAFRGEGRFYQCGFDDEKNDEFTLTRIANDCAGTLRRLAKKASVEVNLPNPPSPPKNIDVNSRCLSQKSFKLASIIPAGWESAKKIDAIPPKFVGKWTLKRFPNCNKMDFNISTDSVDGGNFSALYEQNGSILLVHGLPPYRTSSLLSIKPDGSLEKQIWREEPDAWPEPQKPWTMKSEPMIRCR